MIALMRQRNFALLWTGGLVSMLGNWMLLTALPIYVYQLTGSAGATSLTFIVRSVPWLLFSPIAGVYVDRWDRKRVMLISNVLLAVTLLPLLLVRSADTVWIVYVVAVMQTMIATFFGPAENALLPRVVGEEHLVAANALNALNNNLARLIGPPIGGLIAATMSLPGVAIADALTFLFAALAVALVTVSGKVEPAADAGAPGQATRASMRVWHEMAEGLRIIRRSRRLGVAFAVSAVSSIGEGVFSIAFLLWVSKILGGGAQELGFFYSAQAVGGILGGLVVGRVGDRLGATRLFALSLVLFGLLDLALFNYPRFVTGLAVGLGLMVLVGIPAIGIGSGQNTLLQSSVEDAYRGRVFGAYDTVGALFYLVSVSAMGLIGDRLSPMVLLNVQGSAYILAGIFAWVMLRGATRTLRRPEYAGS